MKPTFPFQIPRYLPNGILIHEGNPPVNRAITVREWFRLQRGAGWNSEDRQRHAMGEFLQPDCDQVASLIDLAHSVPSIYGDGSGLLYFALNSDLLERVEALPAAAAALEKALNRIGYYRQGDLRLLRRSEHTPWTGRKPTRPGMDLIK